LDPAAICRSLDPTAVRELLTKIGDKWKIFVVLSLDLLGGRARFSELERAVPGISQRMLSSTLKNLERDGLVVRELFPELPPVSSMRSRTWGRAFCALRKDCSTGPRQIGSRSGKRSPNTMQDSLTHQEPMRGFKRSIQPGDDQMAHHSTTHSYVTFNIPPKALSSKKAMSLWGVVSLRAKGKSYRQVGRRIGMSPVVISW
jgi:DNA-binding HxlR family transcriptional regulator